MAEGELMERDAGGDDEVRGERMRVTVVPGRLEGVYGGRVKEERKPLPDGMKFQRCVVKLRTECTLDVVLARANVPQGRVPPMRTWGQTPNIHGVPDGKRCRHERVQLSGEDWVHIVATNTVVGCRRFAYTICVGRHVTPGVELRAPDSPSSFPGVRGGAVCGGDEISNIGSSKGEEVNENRVLSAKGCVSVEENVFRHEGELKKSCVCGVVRMWPMLKERVKCEESQASQVCMCGTEGTSAGLVAPEALGPGSPRLQVLNCGQKGVRIGCVCVPVWGDIKTRGLVKEVVDAGVIALLVNVETEDSDNRK